MALIFFVIRRAGELKIKNEKLETALSEIDQLKGIIPICASCKMIRDDEGYRHEVETYIRDHSDAEFSHGLCPGCARKIYPGAFTKK